jgi:hypothetical protein
MELEITWLNNKPVNDLEEVLEIKGQLGVQAPKQPYPKDLCEAFVNVHPNCSINFLLKGGKEQSIKRE